MNAPFSLPAIKISMSDIEWATRMKFGLSKADIRSPVHKRKIARPRQIVMFLARELTSMSFPQIARYYGKDWTTAIFAVKRIRNLMATDAKLANTLEEIRQAVTTAPRAAQEAHLIAGIALGRYALVSPAMGPHKRPKAKY